MRQPPDGLEHDARPEDHARPVDLEEDRRAHDRPGRRGVVGGRPSTIASLACFVVVNTDERGEQESLFWSVVASDHDMYELWRRPADLLDLPILARAYDEGLKLRGDAIVALRREVESLCAYWVETVGDGETRTIPIGDRIYELPLLVLLMSRAEIVESALRLAIAVDGYVTIS